MALAGGDEVEREFYCEKSEYTMADSHDCEIPMHHHFGTTGVPAKSKDLHSVNKAASKPRYPILTTTASCVLLLWLLNYMHLPPKAAESFSLMSPTIANANTKAIDSTRDTNSSKHVLDVFQVYRPVSIPQTITDGDFPDQLNKPWDYVKSKDQSCNLVLMEHSFGFSYGKPFVSNYTPPNCKFNKVLMNFKVTSKGRQFDRLAIMYFGDTEIWRTSTAEPTLNGIRWQYIKDMSAYMYFWNSPQKLIFDLGNLVDDTYTGIFHTTLTSKFLYVDDASQPASLIIPISAKRSSVDASSVFMLPSDKASNTIAFPRNVDRAVFSISACGQADEEFWWSNVLQSTTHTFENATETLLGYSPFREVQLLIDGELAGVYWPFPVVFTGGISPGLWRPIVGIDTFDLREHEIDITPWLPILCDGKHHTFEIRVVGIEDDGDQSGKLTKTVGHSWYVTGKIFVWLDDDPAAITIGRSPILLLPTPVITISQAVTQDETGANETLKYITDVKRTLSISSLVTIRSGTHLVTWTQNIAFSNLGYFTNYGATQESKQSTTGIDQSTGHTYSKSSYLCPLHANTSFIIDVKSGNFSIDANLTLGLDITTQGSPVHPTGLQRASQQQLTPFSATSLSTTLNGTAHYFASPKARMSTGFGSTSQEFSFCGRGDEEPRRNRELYYRIVEAVNSTVVKDYEVLDGVEQAGGITFEPLVASEKGYMIGEGPRQILGRGPGLRRAVLVQSGHSV